MSDSEQQGRKREDQAETEGLGTRWDGVPEGTSGSAAPGTAGGGEPRPDSLADARVKGGGTASKQVGSNAEEGFTTAQEQEQIRRVTGPTEPGGGETAGTTADGREGVPTGERGGPEPPAA